MLRAFSFFVWGFMLLCFVSCSAATPVTLVKETQSPTKVIAECTVDPTGLALQVKLGSKQQDQTSVSQIIELEGQGFMPSETISIRIQGQGASHNRLLEGLTMSVDDKGQFLRTQLLQLDEPNMTWQVQVKHQRGIACVSFKTE